MILKFKNGKELKLDGMEQSVKENGYPEHIQITIPEYENENVIGTTRYNYFCYCIENVDRIKAHEVKRYLNES